MPGEENPARRCANAQESATAMDIQDLATAYDCEFSGSETCKQELNSKCNRRVHQELAQRFIPLVNWCKKVW